MIEHGPRTTPRSRKPVDGIRMLIGSSTKVSPSEGLLVDGRRELAWERCLDAIGREMLLRRSLVSRGLGFSKRMGVEGWLGGTVS